MMRLDSKLTLNVDTPFLRVKTESLEGSGLAKTFGLIDMFIAAVVSCSWVTLGVLVLHDTA
jgi:hypothetical protein